MVDWVRYTCILCYTLVLEINLSIISNCNVLKKSISSDCVVDIRLRLFVKTDNLSVASTLEVEYAVVIQTGSIPDCYTPAVPLRSTAYVYIQDILSR